MIDNLRALNFKALTNNSIKFRQITVLAGGNSVGKSSTIQCLLLLRSMFDSIKSQNLQGADGTIDVELNGPYMLSLGSTQEVISWESGRQFVLEVQDNIGGVVLVEFEAKVLDNTHYLVKGSFPELAGLEISIIDNDFYYLNAERLGPRVRHWVNSSSKNINCGYQGEYTIDVLARIGDDPEFVIPEQKFYKKQRALGGQTLAKHTQNWMDFIIPGTNFNKAEILGQLRSTTIQFNSFFSAPNVGFGVSYILPIVVTGLIAQTNSILIVENPEAHLHPKGQSNIGYFLGCMASAGIQIIIETHSEHVVNGLRLAILECDETKPESLIINFYKDRESKEIDEKYGKLAVDELVMDATGSLSAFPIDFFDQAQQDLLKIYNLVKG